MDTVGRVTKVQGSDWIIEKGLKPGDQVIVEGTQKAKEGALVNPKPYEPPKPFTGVHVDANGPFTRGGTFAPQPPKYPRRPGEPPGF